MNQLNQKSQSVVQKFENIMYIHKLHQIIVIHIKLCFILFHSYIFIQNLSPIPCPIQFFHFPKCFRLFARFPMAGRLCEVDSPLTRVRKHHHWNPHWRLLSSKDRSRRTSRLHSSISFDRFFQIPLTCSS